MWVCHTPLLVVNKNEQKVWRYTADKLSFGWCHYIWSSAACLSLRPCFMAISPNPISVYKKYSEGTMKRHWFWSVGLSRGRLTTLRSLTWGVLSALGLREHCRWNEMWAAFLKVGKPEIYLLPSYIFKLQTEICNHNCSPVLIQNANS